MEAPSEEVAQDPNLSTQNKLFLNRLAAKANYSWGMAFMSPLPPDKLPHKPKRREGGGIKPHPNLPASSRFSRGGTSEGRCQRVRGPAGGPCGGPGCIPPPPGPHDIIGTARDRSPPAAGSGGRSSALRAQGERGPCRGRNGLTPHPSPPPCSDSADTAAPAPGCASGNCSAGCPGERCGVLTAPRRMRPPPTTALVKEPSLARGSGRRNSPGGNREEGKRATSGRIKQRQRKKPPGPSPDRLRRAARRALPDPRCKRMGREGEPRGINKERRT